MAPAAPKMLVTEQLVHSAALELKHQASTHAITLLSKDEDLRRLRVELHVLEDDNDELREQLQHEAGRSDAFEQLVGTNLARAEEAEAALADAETDLRAREAQLQAALAEREALQHASADTAAALGEKLALTRELSVLKPELEHLRVQAASAEQLMGEKLALQRQLTEMQCEAENARREAKRALAKRRNTGVEIAQEEQVDDLKRQLAKERRARERAEQALETASGEAAIDDVRKQLSKERKARQKVEVELEAARESAQVDDVRQSLLKEKKAKAKLEEAVENLTAELEREKKSAARAAKRADESAEADDELENLRNELAKERKDRAQSDKASSELAKEKKERAQADQAAQQAIEGLETTKATLEEKLKSFRAKLRAAKEELAETKKKLTETEEQLASSQAAASANATKKPITTTDPKPAAAKATKKRNAAHIDSDAATLGTPGDKPATKRKRKAPAGVGDKSTFSITPFLNKTVSVINDEGDEDVEASADEPSPITSRKQPLAQQSASASNVERKEKPAAQRKPKSKPTLAMVTEENEDVHSQGQENAAGRTLTVQVKDFDGPEKPADEGRKQKKVRKSIADIPVLAAEPEVKKKKRKLGGLGKTLFDEEDEAAPAPAASKGLFGSKGFGSFGAGKKIGVGSSFLGRAKTGATLLASGDGSGFQFSPLKKARRNLDDTLRG